MTPFANTAKNIAIAGSYADAWRSPNVGTTFAAFRGGQGRRSIS